MSKQTKDSQNHMDTTLHKPHKPWYKRVWVWVLVVFVLACIGVASEDTSKPTATKTEPTAAATETKQETRWDPATYYDQIQSGQTKQQVEQLTGKTSDNCSASESPGVGTMEICTYGGGFSDKGSLMVTYTNGTVYSKTKNSY